MLDFISVGLIAAGGLLALICGKKARLATLSGITFLIAGVVLSGVELVTELQAWTGKIALNWFQFPVLVLALAAALYSPGYLHGHGSDRSNVYWFFFNITVAAMLMVTRITQMWTLWSAGIALKGLVFMLAWEIMGAASFALVMFDRHSQTARRAGWIYMAACHAGGALLILFFLFPDRGLLSFFLALTGFGLKIGFPLLHIWLPDAHPAAPAPVSALMSGAMIELGFLGLISLAVLPGDMAVFRCAGWTLLILGVCGALGGIIFALPQNNLKRLLAYSSIENMGLISIAFALGLLGRYYRIPAMEIAGFAGAVLHVLNHALLKGGLFLCAGSVLKSTGTLEMDKLGGMMRRTPATGTAFTLHAAGICGLPPFNGFVSEFLIYFAAFNGIVAGSGVLPAAATLVLISVALTGGIATAALVKAVGAVFLGEPRSEAAVEAREVSKTMVMVQFALFALSLLMVAATPWILQLWGGDELSVITAKVAWASVGVTVLILALLFIQKCCCRRGIRRSITWDCGYAAPDARMEYTGTAFTQPLSDLFNPVLKVKKELVKPEGIFPERAGLKESVADGGVRNFWSPLTGLVNKIAAKSHRLQSGSLHFYILLVLLALVAMLVYAMVRG